MKTLICTLIFLLLFVTLSGPATAQVEHPRPPTAKKIPKTITIHHDARVDDYFWLREKTNPEVVSHLEAENAYTDAMMKPLAGPLTGWR